MAQKRREKKYAKSAAEFKPLAFGHGGCIATDRITVEGRRVGYCYRETTRRRRQRLAVLRRR